MVNIIENFKNTVANFLEEITRLNTNPVADHLFEVQDKSKAEPLLEEQAMAFHHATAQLLFLSAHARCNIQPITSFLTTCVKFSVKDT